MRRLAFLFALLLLTGAASAQDAFTVTDVPTYSAGMGRAEGPFTLVSLRDGRVVVAPDAASRADSASTAWDLGIRATSLVVNGGASGPGRGAAVLVEAPFDEVRAVPADSLFLTDGDRPCPRGAATAVCAGSGNGWYDYTGNGVEPIPGRTLVVRLAEGGVVKVRFLGYRLAEATASGERTRYVSFEVAPLGLREPVSAKSEPERTQSTTFILGPPVVTRGSFAVIWISPMPAGIQWSSQLESLTTQNRSIG